jgi:hypothetical protein
MTEDNYFPRLNRSLLIPLAAKLASRFGGVNQITLHHGKDGHRYLLLFLLDGAPSPKNIVPPLDQSPQEWPSEYKKAEASREEEILWASFIREDAFHDVYADGKPLPGYENEWFVWPIFTGEERPSFASSESWQLYPCQGTAQQSPAKERTAKQIAAQNAKRLVKEEVRKVAKTLWQKDPSITKADMAVHDDINSIPGASEMTEKTLGEWIKDLNPNRRPGRRPKQT